VILHIQELSKLL